MVLANQVSDLTYIATSNAVRLIAGIAHPRLPADPPPTAGREPTATERAELIGTYRIGRRTFTIEELDGRLVRRVANPFPITMTAKDRFIAVTSSNGDVTEFQVVRDAAGKVHYLFTGQSAFPRIKDQ